MSKSLVSRVDNVAILLTMRQPPHLIVTARGTVPTEGWRNAELLPYVYIEPPADGIQDFCFVAEPPTEFVAQVLTPIEATYTIDPLSARGVGISLQGVGTSPLWVRGVRVHASSNAKEAFVDEVPGGGRVFVKGTLTDEGVECQALRAQSGELYTLAGDLKDFEVGDPVYVLGTVVPISFCMQGTTIAVDWIGKEAPGRARRALPQLPLGVRNRERVELWRQLSEAEQAARATPYPTLANDDLQHQLNSEPEGFLSPAMLMWMSDNFLAESRFEEAVALLQRLKGSFGERWLGTAQWGSIALDKLAVCYERLGQLDRALDTLQESLRGFSGGRSLAHLHYRMGRIAEGAGRHNEAAAAYERAAAAPDEPSETQVAIPDLARRNVARLHSERKWMRADPERLAMELARALEAGDAEALASLASPSHFSLAVLHGDRIFVDSRQLMEIIRTDMTTGSRVRADPFALEGQGRKRYLTTEGWQGAFLQGRVVFLLTRALDAWEWSGIALTRFSDQWSEILGSPSSATNQDLAMAIKAPWPRGEHFRAGGIIPFAAQLALCLALPGFLAAACIFARSRSSCGFGPGGLYYNGVAGFSFTHDRDEAFAIDFATFTRGLPFHNRTHGIAALAVQSGLVLGVRDTIATGDDTIDNRVIVRHLTEQEMIDIPPDEIVSGQPLPDNRNPRYSSIYLHLDGPFRIPVSDGMYVRQGARLGEMDDTGVSVGHHLHFSIHDRDVPNQPGDRVPGYLWPPGRSVRPTPMDGQRLLNQDDGRCVSSTNVPHDPGDAPQPGTPQLSFSPQNISFGLVPVGDIRTRQMRIRNVGLVDVSLSFPAASPPFSMSAFTAVIPPGGERQEIAEFTPLSDGFVEQTLVVQSNAFGNPHTVRLSGRGTTDFEPL
jgi:tetratricopeptide (TPR) repeat protein